MRIAVCGALRFGPTILNDSSTARAAIQRALRFFAGQDALKKNARVASDTHSSLKDDPQIEDAQSAT
jgi:hypothetical protein